MMMCSFQNMSPFLNVFSASSFPFLTITCFPSQPAASVPNTTPLWPTRPAWCPETATLLIGYRGVPVRRPAGPPTCLLVTVCGHESWLRFHWVGGDNVPSLRKRKLATLSGTCFQTVRGMFLWTCFSSLLARYHQNEMMGSYLIFHAHYFKLF